MCDELEARVEKGEGVVPKGTPRVMVSGRPMAVPNWKLPFVFESSGAVMVGEASCIGTRNTRDLVREDGRTAEEMLEHLVLDIPRWEVKEGERVAAFGALGLGEIDAAARSCRTAAAGPWNRQRVR